MTILAFIFWVVIALFASGIVTHRKDTQPKNKVHFYVARDKGGYLYLHIGKPFRDRLEFSNKLEIYYRLRGDNFKYLGLKEKDYDYLKWEDEPVEVFVNIED